MSRHTTSEVFKNDIFAESEQYHREFIAAASAATPGPLYWLQKKIFDISICVLLLPICLLTGLFLVPLNLKFNRGPLLFFQVRMGKDRKPFYAIKFRSMTSTDTVSRGANDPLEISRITRLGKILRKLRLDELPQIYNVFAGQMSLIGPRPDFFSHAKVYARTIPGYRERHSALPGISGYAQTVVGYAEGIEATRAKVRADLYYISNQSFRLDVWILWRTIRVVLGYRGS